MGVGAHFAAFHRARQAQAAMFNLAGVWPM